ncbi:hypothetical protein KEM52_003141, partial [Ascosphaera acerosa]
MVRFPPSGHQVGGGDGDDAANAGGESNVIRVTGRAAVVDAIVARIEAFVAEREDVVTRAVDVPSSQHRKLIGRGGDARRALESRFGVALEVPRQGSGRTDVKIKGPSAKVAQCAAYIAEEVVVEEGREEIAVPLAIHRA